MDDSYEVRRGLKYSERKIPIAKMVDSFVEKSYDNFEEFLLKNKIKEVADAFLPYLKPVMM
jgi:hypothetical protein